MLADHARVKEDYERIRQLGGKSIETLETLTNDKATLEVQLATQVRGRKRRTWVLGTWLPHTHEAHVLSVREMYPFRTSFSLTHSKS